MSATTEPVATATAGVRWCLYKYPKSGDPEGRKEILRHPALDLWNRPNPFQTRMAFVEARAKGQVRKRPTDARPRKDDGFSTGGSGPGSFLKVLVVEGGLREPDFARRRPSSGTSIKSP